MLFFSYYKNEVITVTLVLFAVSIKQELEFDMVGMNELQLAVYLFQESVSRNNIIQYALICEEVIKQ